MQFEFGNERACGRRAGPSAAHAEETAATAARIVDAEAEETGRGRGDAQRRFGAAATLDRAYGRIMDAVLAAFQHGAASSKGQRPDSHGLGEFISDPGITGLVVARQQRAVGDIAVGQLIQREVASAGGHLGPQGSRASAALRLPDGNHGNIFIKRQFGALAPAGRRSVLERTCPGEGFRENHVEGAAPLHRPPDKTLHRILGLHPRTAGGTPTGGRCDGEFEAQGIGRTHSDLESFLPAFVHIDEPFVHDGGRPERGVEIVDAAQADPLHPLQVLADPVLRDVPVHPVPPDTGPGGLGRIRPAFLQLGRSGCGALRPAGGGGSAGHGQRDHYQTNQLFHLLYTNFFVSGSRR